MSKRFCLLRRGLRALPSGIRRLSLWWRAASDWRRWKEGLGAWASWRHPVWRLGLLALLALLLLARTPDPPPVPPVAPPEPPAATMEAEAESELEPALAAILAAARQEAVAASRRRLHEWVKELSHRVEGAFLPHYLSFGRRKLEEIRAYNTFAWGWIKGLFGGERQKDAAVPVLVATFQEAFEQRVSTPAESRAALREIGRDTARRYVRQVALALQDLQEARAWSFVDWQAHLERLPPRIVPRSGQPNLEVPFAALAAPDPAREQLGESLGRALEREFLAWPAVTADPRALRLPDGQSIFDIGRHAGMYYGSYVVYWILLIFLVRQGFIPINLSGALIGWLVWEVFAWGTWIGWESIDFEQTRAQLEPVILEHTDQWFAGLRARLTDEGPEGPFQALWALER